MLLEMLDTHDNPPAPKYSTPSVPGIERRLVRRAERMWDELRGATPMPHARAAGPLLMPPFASNAIVIIYPPADAPDDGTTIPARNDPAALPAFIAHVGEDIGRLCQIATGDMSVDAGPDAPLGHQLAAAAQRAIRGRAPERLDSEQLGAGAADTAILMRSIALPIHTSMECEAAIIITSWRRLLSRDETAALHREMEAAMGWMRDAAAAAESKAESKDA